MPSGIIYFPLWNALITLLSDFFLSFFILYTIFKGFHLQLLQNISYIPCCTIHLCSLFYFIYIFINLFVLFIYFWLHWVFVATRGLSLVAASRGYSSLWCEGFSLQWLLLLRSTGSRHVGFSSCGAWAQ